MELMEFDFFGLVILILFFIFMIVFSLISRRLPIDLRPMKGFEALGNAVERSVESGDRVHLSLGTGSLIGAESAPGLAGLALLGRVASATRMSDKPVVVTAGDGAMAILAQDSLRSAYQGAGEPRRYQPTAGRVLGLTPFSYAAGLPLVLANEDISVHLLVGSFGTEGALAAHFGDRQQAFVLGGTDDVTSQALLFATAEHPLIGEEIFATGAYLDVGPLHQASLHAQDLLRALIVLVVLAGSLWLTFGGGL
jgi:hypothetical protein